MMPVMSNPIDPKTERFYTFIVKGVVLEFYNYGEDYDLHTFEYTHSYRITDRKDRPTIQAMWDDMRSTVKGQAYIHTANLDILLLIPIEESGKKSRYQVTALSNLLSLGIPEQHKFEEHLRIGG